MKTSYKLISIVVIGLSLLSCDSFLEDDIISPNDPLEVTPQTLLANVEVATFASYTGQLNRQSLLFSRQLAGTSAGSQSQEIARYVVTEITNENEWEVIYAGAVVDCKAIISEYGAESPYYSGIAKVILALNYGIATDLWGDVPVDEAGLGEEVGFEPAYEQQSAVLNEIQKLLDEAIVELGSDPESNLVRPGSDDLIFGGDVSGWITAAWIIKARYANRLSLIDPAGSATDVLSFVQNSGATDPSTDAFMPFFGGNAANQWYQFELDRGGNYRMSEYFVNLLVDNNDPRLPYFISEDDAGGYSGTPFDDDSNSETSYVGSYYATASAPLPLVTYVEGKFLEAEAQFRLQANGLAADAHNTAVAASITQVTGGIDSLAQAFIDNFGSEDVGSITLEKIMMQKYIAMFLQIEVYSDQRRVGIPNLIPNPGASTGIPLRLPTPQSERLYNSKAIVVSSTQVPVYWDVN